MYNDTTYMHFGNDMQESLNEYGMVCRREKSDQYYFIYKVDDKFEEGFICESEVKDFLDGEAGYSKTEIKDFLNNTAGTTYNKFLELPILEQVYKLSKHFGSETILGKAVADLTLFTAVDILETE